MGIVAGLAMAITCWRLWLPITTEFEPRGVVLTALGQRRRISWREIDHFELRERGVFLCTSPGPVHESPLRCLFLPWVEDRQALSEFCDEYRPMDRLG
jgi:hypothetical protein